MEELEKALGAFKYDEMGTMFVQFVQSIDRLASDGTPEQKAFAAQVSAMLQSEAVRFRQNKEEAERLRNHVHIVFSLADAGRLKVTLSRLGLRGTYEVLAFDDLLSVGPVAGLLRKEGRQRRAHWMMERLHHAHYDAMTNRDHQIGPMIERLTGIPENKTVTIWCANNAHDQLGLRLAAHLLRTRLQPIRVVNCTEACREIDPSRSEESVYAMGLIDEELFREVASRGLQAGDLDDGQRKRYEAEWLDWAQSGHTLRLWRNGNIEGVPEDELDGVIVDIVRDLQREEAAAGKDGFVKAGRVCGLFFERVRQTFGDSFIQYRMWRLIGEGALEFRGLPGELYKFSVRAP